MKHNRPFSSFLSIQSAIACGGVFLAAFTLYTHTIHHDFVWDDYGVIVHNRNIRSYRDALKTLHSSALKPFEPGDPSKLTKSNYRPLRTLLHAVAYSWWGTDSAAPYHLLNIVAHAVVCSLAFLFFLQIFKNVLPALCGALLFAVHPVNTEAVCWAKSVEDLMAAAFLMITVLLFPLPSKRVARGVFGSPISYALALLSKLSTSFLPVFIVLNDWFSGRRRQGGDAGDAGRSLFRLKPSVHSILTLIMVVEVASAFLLRRWVVGKFAQQALSIHELLKTWLSMPRVFLRYLRLEVLPIGLLVDYRAYPAAESLVDPVAWMFAGFFIVVFCLVTWWLWKHGLSSGWLWFWAALLPFANLVPMVQLGAERFLYIPTIGFVWLLVDVLWRFPRARKWFPLFFCAVIPLFAALTIQRSVVWRDGVTLWEDAHRHWRGGSRIMVNLVKVYNWKGRYDDALPLCLELYEKCPNSHHAWLLGYTLCLMDEEEEGIPFLIESKTSPVLNHVGLELVKKGEFALAAVCFRQASVFSPGNKTYLDNLIVLLRDHPELLRESGEPDEDDNVEPPSKIMRASSSKPRPGVVK